MSCSIIQNTRSTTASKPFIIHSSAAAAVVAAAHVYHPEFPPTPSSSTFSFLVNETKKSIGEYLQNKAQCAVILTGYKITEQVNHTQLDTNSNRSSNPCYGSVFSTTTSDFQYNMHHTTSTASTTSPNDDDEGLYLLWTHQLLRERGYQPSSCKLDANVDCCSIDSSITDVSTVTRRKPANLLNLLLSWFPMC